MLHKSAAVEDGVLKVIYELDCAEVAGIYTELTEHAVTQVILVIEQQFLLLAVGSSDRGGCDFYGAVGADLLAHRAGAALVLAVFILWHHEHTAMTLGDMLRLAVLWVLLRHLGSQELAHGNVHTRQQGLDSLYGTAEI